MSQTTMRIMDAPQPGGPEVLVLGERPVPRPERDEVLIRVAAAGINRADILQRRGLYPSPPGSPPWPGLEVAGVVEAVGEGVSAFRPGDPVCALLAGGGYADYASAPVGQTLPVPQGLSLVEAAALPEACFTVWSNIWGFGRLQPGERLLVHGGASGIGTTAIQIARARGHSVYATAGSDEKCRFCESLGAARGIDYRREDFVEVLRSLTGGEGVDVVLDIVGGDYVQRDLNVLSAGGRVVLIALAGGSKATINLAQIMTQRLVVTGSTLRSRPVAFKARVKAELLQQVWPLYERGEVRPVIDRVFAFERAAEAHAYLESGVHKGKIVLSLD